MIRKAMIVWGGWDGHQPREVAEVFRRALTADGFSVEVSDTLDSFCDQQNLDDLSSDCPRLDDGDDYQ